MKNYGAKLGRSNEAKASQVFHQRGLPLLVSPLVLRKQRMGQLDLARILILSCGERELEVREVKSGLSPSPTQRVRIARSADWLGQIFNLPTRVDYHFMGPIPESFA